MFICACHCAGSRNNALAWWDVQCDGCTQHLAVLAKAAAAMLLPDIMCIAMHVFTQD